MPSISKLEARLDEALRLRAEQRDAILAINAQIESRRKPDKAWLHRALSAKRHRLKEVSDLDIEILALRREIGKLKNKASAREHQVFAEAFMAAAKEMLPDVVFNSIIETANSN